MPKSPGSPVPGRRPPTLDSFTQGPWTFSTVKVNQQFVNTLCFWDNASALMLHEMLCSVKKRPCRVTHILSQKMHRPLLHLFSFSSLTSWPLRTRTTCLRSSHCHTSPTCSSYTTGWRCGGQRKLKRSIQCILLSWWKYVFQVAHSSGATIEYSPVEALKRVREIFRHANSFRVDLCQIVEPHIWVCFLVCDERTGDRILVFCTLCHENSAPWTLLLHITWWKTVGLILVTSPNHLSLPFRNLKTLHPFGWMNVTKPYLTKQTQ